MMGHGTRSLTLGTAVYTHSAADPSASSLRILALEDNDEDYQIVRRFLASLGPPECRMTWAVTIADAMTALETTSFDVCLVDLHLPDGNGLQVLRWLTDTRPEVATVVMTGDEHPDTDRMALVAGADYFLAKSEWNAASLPRAVRYAVAHRRRLHDLTIATVRATGASNALPICMDCKKIRDEHDYWHALEAYLLEHAGLKFSHGFCPACYRVRLDELRQISGAHPD